MPTDAKPSVLRHSNLLMLMLMLGSTAVSGLRADEIGHAVLIRGAVTAQSDGDVRLLGYGEAIRELDVLSTGERSFAVFELQDGTRLSLRPNTVVAAERYSAKRGEESALLRLFKGGLRTVTGWISKRRPDGFQLATHTATVGVRGTDLLARLCTEDCAREAEARPQSETVAQSPVVGRVVLLKGSLTATNAAGVQRQLTLGAPLETGDVLETAAASFAIVVFRDESRITLQASTRFRIEILHYEETDPEASRTLLRLFKGGVRAATGLVGKLKPRTYTVATPVADLSVRGTRFDLVCRGTCVGTPRRAAAAFDAARLISAVIPAAYAQTDAENGIYIVTREGDLLAHLGEREVGLPANRTIFMDHIENPPKIGVTLPPDVVEGMGPEPESIAVDPGLFGYVPLERIEPDTLVVSVNDGHVTMRGTDGATVELGTGETAVATGRRTVRVIPQPFMAQDPYLEIDPIEVRDDALPPGVVDPTGEAIRCRVC